MELEPSLQPCGRRWQWRLYWWSSTTEMKAYWRKWCINIFQWRQWLWWLIFCWEWDWKSKNNIPRARRHAHGKSYTSIFNFRYGMNNSIYNRLESLIFICRFIIVGYCTGRRQKLVRIFYGDQVLCLMQFFILSAAIKNIHLRCHFGLLKAFKNGKIRSCVVCYSLHVAIICVFDIWCNFVCRNTVKVSYFKAPNHIGGPSEQAMLAQEIPNWCLTAPIENF